MIKTHDGWNDRSLRNDKFTNAATRLVEYEIQGEIDAASGFCSQNFSSAILGSVVKVVERWKIVENYAAKSQFKVAAAAEALLASSLQTVESDLQA